MRRIVAVVVAALMVTSVVFLGGCASSPESSSSAPSSGSAPAAAPPAPPSASKTAAVTTLSAPPQTTPRPFPTVSAVDTPAAVVAALKGKHAFILVFYDTRQTETDDQKRVIAAMQNKYRGLIDVVTFDLATLTSAKKDSAAYKEAASAVTLGQKLTIGYMPAIVIVSKDGQITWQSSGVLDEGSLEREILRATR